MNYNLSDDFNRLYAKSKYRFEKIEARFQKQKEEHRSRKILLEALKEGEDYIYFGDKLVPLSYPFHGLIEGRTGAGKTHFLERYLLSIYYARTRTPHNKYFFQLHTKNDDTDLFIKEMCRRCGIDFLVYRLDELTEDSIAIDIARSINGKALRMLNFSRSIFLDARSSTSDPFWYLSAELIVFNLLRGLYEIYGNDYGLHHLVDLGLGTIPILQQYLVQTERGKQIRARFFNENSDGYSKTTESILAVIAAYISDLELAGSIQAQLHQSRWYSLKKLISGNSKSLFIYSPSEYQYATQKPIHALFNWLVPEITALADQRTTPRHGFITIDELSYWGKMSSLLRIAELSRSVGFHLMVAYQNRQSLEKIYDKELRSILGNTSIKVMFAPTDAQSAQAFIDNLGASRQYEIDYNFTQGGFKHDLQNFRQVTKPPLTTGQIMRLPMASPTTGLNCWMNVPEEMGFLHRIHIPPEEIDRQIAFIESLKDSVRRQRSLNLSKTPKHFTLREQFYVLKKMLNSSNSKQMFMEGYEDSLIAPIRESVWHTMSHLINAVSDDLFEFIANRLDE